MKKTIILLFVVLIVSKFVIASHLDLFGDEAFYWQCAQRPDFSFILLPPLNAMFVRAGTEILGDTLLGVRFLFLVCGIVFPFAVYTLARPLVGERDAWLAAGATLVLPCTAPLGLFAVPDFPMLLMVVLSLLGFERATREGSLKGWGLAGIGGAVGFLTHHRFILLPVAAFLYLILTPRGRGHLRQKGPWLTGLLLLLGLIPALVNNLRTDFEPVRYYLAGRHGSSFSLEAFLEFIIEQVLVTTPFFFFALLGVVVMLLKHARKGDDRATFFSIFALTPLLVFLLASPFEDLRMTTVHWPVPGYVVLLPYLPVALRSFVNARPTLIRKISVGLVPGLGAVAILLVLIELGTGCLKLGALRRPFVGWTEVAEKIRQEYLPEMRIENRNRFIVVADNYVLGANLDFFLHDQADVYILNHARNRKHGRERQYDIWNTGEDGLRERTGENALVVVQLSRTSAKHREAWLGHVGSFFERLEPLGELRKEKPRSPGKCKRYKVFKFFKGVRICEKGTSDSIPVSFTSAGLAPEQLPMYFKNNSDFFADPRHLSIE